MELGVGLRGAHIAVIVSLGGLWISTELKVQQFLLQPAVLPYIWDTCAVCVPLSHSFNYCY